MGGQSWGDVAGKRNQQDIRDYKGGGNPAWRTPTGRTSKWNERPQWDAEAEQKRYDEAELRRAVRTEKTLWGRERKYDQNGREIKDPSRKNRGWF